MKNKNPTRCQLLFNAPLTGLTCFEHYYAHHQELATYVDYHIGCIVLGLLYVGGKVSLGWSSATLRV